MSFPLNNQDDVEKFVAAVREGSALSRADVEQVIATVREHPEWKEANLLADELRASWTENDDWRENNIRFMVQASPIFELQPGESRVVIQKSADS